MVSSFKGLHPFASDVCQFGQNCAADQMKIPELRFPPFNPLVIPIAVICKHIKYASESGKGIPTPHKFQNPFPPFNPHLFGGQSGIKDSPGRRIKRVEHSHS